jgi:hypothetical protein
MPSIDDIINVLPGTPQQKAAFAAVAVAIYGIALVVRGFTREGSKLHAVCNFIVNGLRPRAALTPKDPQPQPPSIQTEPPKTPPAA